ncbi:hypothetical protein MCOR02_009365 [Pyricularia oryzae]|nr:hypothetical protein MCOR02_009365 [Pyricularia oryzae]
MTPKSPAIEHYIAKLQSSNSTLPQPSLRLSTLYTLQTNSHKPSHHGMSFSALGVYSDDTTFEAGNACSVPVNLKPFDTFYFNATAGATVEKRKSALVKLLDECGVVQWCWSEGLIQSGLFILLLLMYHMNGEVGKSINTSTIVSRIV